MKNFFMKKKLYVKLLFYEKHLFILFQFITLIEVQSDLGTIHINYVQPAAFRLYVAWHGWQCSQSSAPHCKGAGL